jgi:hypothetical protein
MSAPEDDDPPRSHPYRTPLEVRVEPPASSRKPRAKMLSALAAISAASGAEDVSETLSRRAADARGCEDSDAMEEARALRRKARSAFEEGRWEIAEALYRRVLALLLDGVRAPVLDDVIALATTLRHVQRFYESETLFRRATASREELRDEAPIVAAHDLAALLIHLGRLGDARRILERALERADDVASRTPTVSASHDVARVHHALAECALDDDDVLTARRHVDVALEMRADLDGRESHMFGATLATAGRVFQVAGEPYTAADAFWRAIDLTSTPQGHTLVSAQIVAMLAGLHAEARRVREAARCIDEALSVLDKLIPAHTFLCRALRIRARIERLSGHHERADATETKVARIVALWCG